MFRVLVSCLAVLWSALMLTYHSADADQPNKHHYNLPSQTLPTPGPDPSRSESDRSTDNHSGIRGEKGVYGESISSHYEESSKMMVVRDKKICEKLGLKAIEMQGVSNPYSSSGKFYRCTSDVDIKTMFLFPPPPPPEGGSSSESGCRGESDPKYPHMNFRSEDPPNLIMTSIIKVDFVTTDYANYSNPNTSVDIMGFWNLTSYCPLVGGTPSDMYSYEPSIGYWASSTYASITQIPDYLSIVSNVAPNTGYMISGNYCYQQAIRLNRAEERFAEYGFYCGSGACPGGEECDQILVPKTCQECSDDEERATCWTYDCSYCKPYVGDCAGCIAAQNEYNKAWAEWSECVDSIKPFLLEVCNFAHKALDTMITHIRGSSPP